MTDTLSLPDGLTFTKDGLIPAIAQQYDTGEVLMMAWMNKDSLAETLATGQGLLLVTIPPRFLAQR